MAEVHDGKVVGVATDAIGESSSGDKTRTRRPSLINRLARKSVQAKVVPDPTLNEAGPTVNDEVVTLRRSTDPGKYQAHGREPSPGLFSPQSSGVGKQMRVRLLGNRKPSNLPTEEQRFKSYRDSLMLAHQRLFRDDGGPVGVKERSSTDSKGKQKAVDPVVESLKRSTWSKPQLHEEINNESPQHLSDETGKLTEETRPINLIARAVRSPSRGVPKDAHPNKNDWLPLSEDVHPKANAVESPPQASSLKRHPSPYPSRGGSGSDDGFLSLTPVVHETASVIVTRKNQQSPQAGETSDVGDNTELIRKPQTGRGAEQGKMNASGKAMSEQTAQSLWTPRKMR